MVGSDCEPPSGMQSCQNLYACHALQAQMVSETRHAACCLKKCQPFGSIQALPKFGTSEQLHVRLLCTTEVHLDRYQLSSQMMVNRISDMRSDQAKPGKTGVKAGRLRVVQHAN